MESHWFHWSHLGAALLILGFVFVGIRLLEKTLEDHGDDKPNRPKE